MELLVGLKNRELLEKISNSVDGIIIGSLFTNKYNYSTEELKLIVEEAKQAHIKIYISIDAFICENDKDEIEKYLKYLSMLDVDGVYFSDLCIIPLSRKYSLYNKLIYDPSTLNTNARDIGFYLANKIDVVLGRELTLEEIAKLVSKYPCELDMQVFGYLRMSYSKRKFLTNYFKELNVNRDVINKDTISLMEESRSYRLPIKETKYGTCIYTDYCLLMFEEFTYLSNVLKRAIIETEFIPEDLILVILRDIKRLTKENAKFLKDNIISSNPNVSFKTGYLYQKTVDRKEDE